MGGRFEPLAFSYWLLVFDSLNMLIISGKRINYLTIRGLSRDNAELIAKSLRPTTKIKF